MNSLSKQWKALQKPIITLSFNTSWWCFLLSPRWIHLNKYNSESVTGGTSNVTCCSRCHFTFSPFDQLQVPGILTNSLDKCCTTLNFSNISNKCLSLINKYVTLQILCTRTALLCSSLCIGLGALLEDIRSVAGKVYMQHSDLYLVIKIN